MSGVPTLALLALLAAGCAAASPESEADAVTAASCRQRADEVMAARDPAQIYNDDTYASSLRDAPFGTNGSPSLPTRGLGDSYQRQQIVTGCINGTGPVGPTPAAPPPAATP